MIPSNLVPLVLLPLPPIHRVPGSHLVPRAPQATDGGLSGNQLSSSLAGLERAALEGRLGSGVAPSSAKDTPGLRAEGEGPGNSGL